MRVNILILFVFLTNNILVAQVTKSLALIDIQSMRDTLSFSGSSCNDTLLLNVPAGQFWKIVEAGVVFFDCNNLDQGRQAMYIDGGPVLVDRVLEGVGTLQVGTFYNGVSNYSESALDQVNPLFFQNKSTVRLTSGIYKLINSWKKSPNCGNENFFYLVIEKYEIN